MNRGTQTTSSQRVAANVGRLLEQSGKTREAFSGQMKWSRATLWRRLGGDRWYLDEVEQAASIFGVEPDALMSPVMDVSA